MVVFVKCDCCSRNTKTYQFEYDVDPAKTTFQQLYELVDIDAKNMGLDIRWYTRLPHIMVDNEEREPLEYASLRDVIRNNNLKDDVLYAYVVYGGIGRGIQLDSRIKLEIREKEDPRHKPHIHVSIKGIGEVQIIIGPTVEMCEIKKGKKNWERFRRKDRQDIIQLIADNYEGFLDFYNDYRKLYIKPRPFKLTFRGREYILQHGSAIMID